MLFADVRYRLRVFFRRNLVEQELTAELEHHVAMQAARYEQMGADPEAARRRARLDLGGTEQVKERTRDVHGTSTIDSIMRDLRYAVRSLLRSPSFTLAAVAALGLGIGSTTAVFSLLQGIVLRPLVFREPARLVSLWENNDAKGLDHQLMSPVNFVDYSSLTKTFSDVAGWWRTEFVLDGEDGGAPLRVPGIEVTSNFLGVLGVSPALGRDFVGDSLLNVPSKQVLISNRLWRSHFGGDPGAIGRSVRVNGQPFTIAGVMPAGFDFPSKVDLWQGLGWTLSQHSRTAHFWEGVGRLAPGATEASANRDLTLLSTQLAREYPASNQGWRASVVRLDREIVGSFRPALFALFGASALLLLIACINVANLLLARGAVRRREIALRLAIGADGRRIMRLMLTESLILAAAGSIVGVVFAVACVRGLLALSPIAIPRAADVRVDGLVVLFSTTVAVITAVAFGLVPAMFSWRTNPADALRSGSRGAGTRSERTRRALVIAEVALAVTLLAGAGLVIRSVSGLLHEDIGVDPQGVVTGEVQLAGSGYQSLDRVNSFFEQLLTQLRDRPDVVAAGRGYHLPLDVAYRLKFTVEGVPLTSEADAPTAQFHSVDEGFFPTFHTPILSGRNFSRLDDSSRTPVVIVNEAFVRGHFPDGNAVGKRIVTEVRNIGPLGSRIVASNTHEIVGVVRDVRNTSLRDAAEPAIYFSSLQFPYRTMHIVARVRSDPAQFAAELRDEVRQLDPQLAIGAVRPMDAVLASSIEPPRLMRMLLGLFASLALSLAAIGIYGIMAYTVASRQREMSVRIALGAAPRGVLLMVVREGLALAVTGFIAGTIVALVGGRSLGAFLYGVTTWDPITMGTVLAVVIGIGGVACLVPAWRASREDPARALRME